jgi:FkbM family methyltransferase
LIKADLVQEVQGFQSSERILKTKYLFLNLLRLIKPDVVIDVGSLDGSDSIRFRLMSPQSKVIAFEANPYHYSNMQKCRQLADSQIEIRDRLISTTPEKGTFYISKGAVAGVIDGNMGTSSSLMPVNAMDVAEQIEVETTRLDKVISEVSSDTEWVALWVDVEGAAYDVLKSAMGVKKQIGLVHIEVELVEYWVGQKLKSDVLRLAEEFGLVLLASGSHEPQHDIVMINAQLLKGRTKAVKFAMLMTKWLGPASSRLLEKF